MIRLVRLSNAGVLCVTLLITLGSTTSQAAPITRTFGFTASNFVASWSPSPPPPQDTVAGMVTLTFDPAVMVSIEAHPDAISLTISGHDFTWDEVTFYSSGPVNADKNFVIGVPGLHVIDAGTNDFTLSFTYDPIADLAKFGYLSYTTAATTTPYGSDSTTVRVVATPEPGLSALLLVGLTGLRVMSRQRQGETTT